MANGSGTFDNVPILLNYDGHSEFHKSTTNSSDVELQIFPVASSPANGSPADSGMPREAGRGGRHEYLLMSGPLGMCNDPYCTSCPYTNVGAKAELHRGLSKHVQVNYLLNHD